MDIQDAIDRILERAKAERAESQMTLGKMIQRLEGMPQDFEMQGFGFIDSYRGYYCDLSFSPSVEKMPVSEVLKEARGAMGKVFTGYKGGDFLMSESTPIWIADYGECGVKIVAINDDGTFETQEDN